MSEVIQEPGATIHDDLYVAGHEDPVDLARTKAKVLLIHDSAPESQPEADQVVAELLDPSEFDRLAFPGPSIRIPDIAFIKDTMRLLHSKHRFEKIIVAEKPIFRRDKTWRYMQRMFKEHGVVIDYVDIDDTEVGPPQALVQYCADLRYQPYFERELAGQNYRSYARLILPGGGNALRHSRVQHWASDYLSMTDPHRPNGPTINEVLLMNHTDCADTGGLANFNWLEYEEALVHAVEMENGKKVLREIAPRGDSLKIHRRLIDQRGILSVKGLHREARKLDGDEVPAN